jgi:hypothetical protein
VKNMALLFQNLLQGESHHVVVFDDEDSHTSIIDYALEQRMEVYH